MIIALTGAGISAASGIPTFNEQPGLRDRLTQSFASTHPDEFRTTIDEMASACENAEPNDAHDALAAHGIPVITMNVDGLHVKAGSEHVLEIHGTLRDRNVVLYGDPAPKYQEAEEWIERMDDGDVLLVVGTSHYTAITDRLIGMARRHNVTVIEVNQSAELELRPLIEVHADQIGDWDEFMSRTGEEGSFYSSGIPGPYQTGGWESP